MHRSYRAAVYGVNERAKLPSNMIAEKEQPHPSVAAKTVRLRLYLRQRTFEAKAALGQVMALLDSIESSYELQVLDVLEYRDLAMKDQVPFTPLLIRLNPAPVKWITVPQRTIEALKGEVLE